MASRRVAALTLLLLAALAVLSLHATPVSAQADNTQYDYDNGEAAQADMENGDPGEGVDPAEAAFPGAEEAAPNEKEGTFNPEANTREEETTEGAETSQEGTKGSTEGAEGSEEGAETTPEEQQETSPEEEGGGTMGGSAQTKMAEPDTQPTDVAGQQPAESAPAEDGDNGVTPAFAPGQAPPGFYNQYYDQYKQGWTNIKGGHVEPETIIGAAIGAVVGMSLCICCICICYIRQRNIARAQYGPTSGAIEL